jgi:hypothetical protein
MPGTAAGKKAIILSIKERDTTPSPQEATMKAFFLLLAALPLGAQVPSAKTWQAPRTPDGKPDLQGVWTSATLTPLERPSDLANKPLFATKEEAEQWTKQFLQANNRDRRDGSAQEDVSRAYNEFWFSRGDTVVPTLRTSLIIDPPEGRIPALTPDGQKRAAARAEAQRLHPADGPEDRPLTDRCILWPVAGPPMIPGGYNNNYQIVQGPGYVMIVVEMIHDVRVIPTDGRPHLPPTIRQWMGDPRGHWEGETLVVDTTNFTNKTTFRGSGENLHLVERFTRTAPGQLMYEFTVNDPESFTRPWTAQIPMGKADGPLVEYACHEGNYAMEGILRGARLQEREKK